AWVAFVATASGPYLGYVFGSTVDAITDRGSGGTRAPFSAAEGPQTPVAERVVALTALAVVFVGIVIATWRLARRRRALSAPMILLALAGLGFAAVVPLKALPGAWETA